jgi:hypothetical protein
LAFVPASLLPLTASCQIVLDKPPAAERTEKVYKNEVYAGYGYTSLNQVDQSRYGLQGVGASYSRDFGKYFGVTGEGTYYFKAVASGNPVNAKVVLGLGGPFIHVDLFDHLSGFLHVLIGGAHTGGASEYPNISFAGGVGGGMEYKLTPRISLRASGDDILSSFAEDPNHLGFSPHRKGNPRAAFGAVYRF